ncbi:MAG TPA: M48 family metallopeptidase [Nitrospiraceae bacterium]|nr:M48 family metallopeptidase [Nitrospiraceae bacterium]
MSRVQQDSRAYAGLSLAFITFSLLACSTNPYTERSQLLLMSQSQETQLGAQAYAQTLQDPKVKTSQDPREVEPVKRVANRIIEAAKASKYADIAQQFEWEVSVIKDDKTLNAFALPGGKIAVYTGIFPIAKNEAGLAAIMGHEVVHALARHGGERMSQNVLAQIGMQAANITLAVVGVDPILSQGAMTALGAGTNVGILLPFSRAHESEADYIGLLLAAQAGYDPREAVRVWERMEQVSKGQPAEFLSTHPSHGTRIKQLEGWMNEALSYYKPQPGTQAAELPSVSAR